MRTTLDINDTLLARAKAAAARERTSLTRLIEEGLALRLRAAPRMASGKLKRLPVFQGTGGVAPGVDPLSNRSMNDAAGHDDDFGGPGFGVDA